MCLLILSCLRLSFLNEGLMHVIHFFFIYYHQYIYFIMIIILLTFLFAKLQQKTSSWLCNNELDTSFQLLLCGRNSMREKNSQSVKYIYPAADKAAFLYSGTQYAMIQVFFFINVDAVLFLTLQNRDYFCSSRYYNN